MLRWFQSVSCPKIRLPDYRRRNKAQQFLGFLPVVPGQHLHKLNPGMILNRTIAQIQNFWVGEKCVSQLVWRNSNQIRQKQNIQAFQMQPVMNGSTQRNSISHLLSQGITKGNWQYMMTLHDLPTGEHAVRGQRFYLIDPSLVSLDPNKSGSTAVDIIAIAFPCLSCRHHTSLLKSAGARFLAFNAISAASNRG